ncbi:MAG: ATP synthase F0 subunit C [bacterium]|jgi:F-type H+-transporting ATPase subunit c
MGEFLVKMAAVLAAAIAMSFGAVGPGIGMGSIGKAALESMARQPELSGKTFTTMLIAMALVEALAIYCLLIALVILYANPMLG